MRVPVRKHIRVNITWFLSHSHQYNDLNSEFELLLEYSKTRKWITNNDNKNNNTKYSCKQRCGFLQRLRNQGKMYILHNFGKKSKRRKEEWRRERRKERSVLLKDASTGNWTYNLLITNRLLYPCTTDAQVNISKICLDITSLPVNLNLSGCTRQTVVRIKILLIKFCEAWSEDHLWWFWRRFDQNCRRSKLSKVFW